ncbi:hypothetical protein BJY04DRAFT_220573 [Aspergillus karnatakaensis]|uniref:uncharacterized protein n=1 Tax=Aspergillus karnatakaensis TaxID=1810916 RepID=UPI003CCDF3A1
MPAPFPTKPFTDGSGAWFWPSAEDEADPSDYSNSALVVDGDGRATYPTLTDQQRPEDFVTFMSTFNAISVWRLSDIEQYPSSFTRNTPTPFKRTCSRCNWSCYKMSKIKEHTATCSPTTPSPTRITCREDCGADFLDAASEESHFRKTHSYRTRICIVSPGSLEFNEDASWTAHERKYHKQATLRCPALASTCLIPNFLFKYKFSFRTHLTRAHKMSTDEADKAIAALTPPKATPVTKCPDCGKAFDRLGQRACGELRKHLQTRHSKTSKRRC